MITITKIRKALEKDNNLKIIRDNYYYLLSDFEKKSLNAYLKNYDLTFMKKDFIRNFINRLKKMPYEGFKKIIDMLSKNIAFEPIKMPLQIGMIFDVDLDMPTETTKPKEKPIGFSKDAYFNDLVAKENYDELFNLYGLREIERDSNLIDGESK